MNARIQTLRLVELEDTNAVSSVVDSVRQTSEGGCGRLDRWEFFLFAYKEPTGTVWRLRTQGNSSPVHDPSASILYYELLDVAELIAQTTGYVLNPEERQRGCTLRPLTQLRESNVDADHYWAWWVPHPGAAVGSNVGARGATRVASTRRDASPIVLPMAQPPRPKDR